MVFFLGSDLLGFQGCRIVNLNGVCLVKVEFPENLEDNSLVDMMQGKLTVMVM